MTNLEIKLSELLSEATATAREIAIKHFVQALMVALAKENYRLNDLSLALADYAKQRDDWGTVVHHLEAAAQEVVRARTTITGQ